MIPFELNRPVKTIAPSGKLANSFLSELLELLLSRLESGSLSLSPLLSSSGADDNKESVLELESVLYSLMLW